MAALASLPTALPLATASLAYLNARYGFSNDWPLVSNFLGANVNLALKEWKDRLNLFYVLEERAQSPADGARPWIIFNGRRWTYRESYRQVLLYARWLKEDLGVAKGEVVAMDCLNGDVFVWLWFALWSLGARPAFINYNLTGQPLLHSIKTSTSRLVLVDAEVRKEFSDAVMTELAKPDFRQEGGSVQVVVLEQSVLDRIETLEEWREPDESRSGQVASDMAILIYTSGTTGLPKPAVVSWAKANTGGRFTSGYLPMKKDDTLYTPMPLYHSSASILGLCSTLRAGAAMALGRKFSVMKFWDEVRASDATMVQYVGETCRYLLSAPVSPLDKQHKVRMAFGNGLRPDVWEAFKTRFGIPCIVEFYAATEGPAMITNRSANGYSQGAVGRVGLLTTLLMGPGAKMIKLDYETNAPLRDPKTGLCILTATNEPGELVFRLDERNIAKKFQGYFGNTKATSSKILRDVRKKGDAWFSTGDILRWDADGRIWFMDRIGDTFRWRSENVSTAEVGEVMGLCPGVAEANVYGVLVPNHDGRAGCAAIVLDGAVATEAAAGAREKAGAPPAQILEALAKQARANLPKYAVPLFCRFTRGMELTGTNKQQKHVLREQGIDVSKIEAHGDAMYWLQGDSYVPFTEGDLARIQDGSVKL